MVERTHRAPVGTFHRAGSWADRLELDEAAAHHASVKRLSIGDVVRLTSGDGRRARAEIVELARRRMTVSLADAMVEQVPRPPIVELFAPVGDRERMLLLAEKAVELGVSVWRPVIYHRSRSVSPRGEGEAFREKVRLRMVSALEQSGGAWLPDLHAEATLDTVLTDAAPGGTDLVLDAEGPPVGAHSVSPVAPVRLALGPEGGFEPAERDTFLSAGRRMVSVGDNVLRFETAGIAGLAIVRSLLGALP